MDIDLVLEVTEEELLEFPEEGPSEGHLDKESTGTLVPDCSQDSLQTIQVYSENTPQKETIHLSNTSNTTHTTKATSQERTTEGDTTTTANTRHQSRGNTPDQNHKGCTTTYSIRKQVVYVTRRNVRF